MEEKVLKLVESSQGGSTNHMKNIKALETIFNSADLDQFTLFFQKIVQVVIEEDYQNPHVKFSIEYLAKFVAHISTVQSNEDTDTEKEPSHPFLISVLQHIIKFHLHPSMSCRYNICSFVSLMLQNVGDNAILDVHIIDLIQNAMLECTQDAKPLVRLQALIALIRLQDPLNPECLVIRAYINCLSDSSHLVRKEAVKGIAPNALTIPKLKERTRDKDAQVRSAAFRHLADIGIKHFKIIHRQFILKSGFAETNPQVKKIFLEYLIPKWLTSLQGSYVALLNSIKLDADEADIINTEELCSQIMQVFFKTEPINNLIEALPLEESRVIQENNIRSELVYYWNIVVKYLRQCETLEDYLERIIPELSVFCNYIDRLITNKFSKTIEDWEYLDFQYLLYHLFDMAEQYDISEEVGRRTLDKLIKKVLRNHRFQPRLLNKMLQIGSKLASTVDSFTNEICLIISDIWQPLIDQPPNEHDKREQDFKIAQLTVKINILEGDLEDAVIQQDFAKAQQLTVQINEEKKKLTDLKAEQNAAPKQPVASNNRMNVDDPETLCWCLDLLAALLVNCNIKALTPSLITCREVFLMPLVSSKNVEIGWRAFKCLTIYCSYDRDLAKKQLKTVCIPIISYRIIPNFNKTILMDSVGIVTDLIRLHGTDFFVTEDEDACNNTTGGGSTGMSRRRLYNEDTSADDVDSSSISNRLTVDFIISILLDMLDDENNEIRDIAITAVAKLILNNFPANAMVMTRLILKWYSPITRGTEDIAKNKDKKINKVYEKGLQQKIGVVIKAYTERVANSREVIAKSIVTILTSIAEAPRTSPLAEVDVDNVVKFLLAITDVSENDNGLLHVHTNIARTLLYEISARPSQIVTVYFAKMLNLLNIMPNKSPAIKELIFNAEHVLEKEILEKAPTHNLIKFINKLRGEMSTNSTITNNNTGDNAEQDHITGRRRLSVVIEDNDSEDRQEIEKNRVSNPLENQSPTQNNKNDENTAETNVDKTTRSDSDSDLIASSQPKAKKLRKQTGQAQIIDPKRVEETHIRRSARNGAKEDNSKKINFAFNGKIRAQRKENRQALGKRQLGMEAASLIVMNCRDKLCERQDNNILMENELVITVNGGAKHNKKDNYIPVQVKRKKSRRSKSNKEKCNGSSISTRSSLSTTSSSGQSLHTIREMSLSQPSLLSSADSSQEKTTVRSSRRSQIVVVSETSSADESPAPSIRKSTRKTKKKTFT